MCIGGCPEELRIEPIQEPADLRDLFERGRLSDRGELLRPHELRGVDASHVRLDHHVRGLNTECVQVVVLNQQAAQDRRPDARHVPGPNGLPRFDVAKTSLQLRRHADGDDEIAAHRHQHIRRDVVDQPAVNQRLVVADDRHGEYGQVDALEDRMDSVAAFANYRVAAHQVDRDGETGDGKLFESPVVQVLAKHWVESPATVFVYEVPVVALTALSA